jgi:hypothetical protein
MNSNSALRPAPLPFQWPAFVVAALVLGGTTAFLAWNFVWSDPVLRWRDGRMAADLVKDSTPQVPPSDVDVFAAALLAACDRQCDSLVVVTERIPLEVDEREFVQQDWDLSPSERVAADQLIRRSRLPYEVSAQLDGRSGIQLVDPSWSTPADAPAYWAVSAPGFDAIGSTAFVLINNRSCPDECGWMDLFGLSRSDSGWQVYGRMRWISY